MVKFAKPEESDEELESMTAEAEYLLQQLGLPYRVISLCTGDLGFSAVRPTTSRSGCRATTPTRRSAPAPTAATSRPAAPTSSTATPRTSRVRATCTPSMVPACRPGRTMAAILENYQNADGTITIPEVLRPYMGRSREDRAGRVTWLHRGYARALLRGRPISCAGPYHAVRTAQ